MAKVKVPNNFWKSLTIINLLLSIAILWLIYSQYVYSSQFFSEKPVTTGNNSPSTAVVINPFTGSFFLIPNPTLIGLFVTLVVLTTLLVFGKSKERN